MVETPETRDPKSEEPKKERAETIPARMLNEFVYCRRLFYYEFVEGVFVESADTLRGGAIHQRVDSGNGALPKAKRKPKAEAPHPGLSQPLSLPFDKPEGESVGKESGAQEGSPPANVGGHAQEAEPETIHSRSVQMGSERLGVIAKMDLVEVRAAPAKVADDGTGDLFTALEVCPVDYKAGAPREGEEANELWDTDKMQLGLQALILRDNGYVCNEGVRPGCWQELGRFRDRPRAPPKSTILPPRPGD
jgi:CRISPR-associated protein Cas1